MVKIFLRAGLAVSYNKIREFLGGIFLHDSELRDCFVRVVPAGYAGMQNVLDAVSVKCGLNVERLYEAGSDAKAERRECNFCRCSIFLIFDFRRPL